MPGITITVNAATAEAAANLAAFVNNAESGLKRIEEQGKRTDAATQLTAGSLKSAGRALSATATNLVYTASMFAGPAVQNAIYPLMMLGKEVKGVSAAMKLTGITAPAAVAGVALLTTAVITGVEAWKAYKAKVEEAQSAVNALAGMSENVNRTKTLINEAVAGGQLSKPDAAELLKLYSDERRRNLDALLAAGDDRDKIRAATEAGALQLLQIQTYVSWKLKNKVLNDDEKKAAEDLIKLNEKYFSDSMEGFAKERYEAQKARAEREAEIEAMAQKTGRARDDSMVLNLYKTSRVAYEIELDRIREKERQAEEDKLEEARKYFEEQNRMSDELHEKFLRQLEEEKKEKLNQIQNDWRLTDAQKYQRTSALGGEPDGPNPSSWAEQWRAAKIEMQNYWGTFQQYATSNVFGTIKSAVGDVSQGITDVIMGTKSWGDMFKQVGAQIVSQLISIAVRSLLIALILKPLGIGFSGGWLLGGMFADGGRPPMNRVSLVGERGPELFVPDTAGTIIPAAQSREFIAGAAGKQTQAGDAGIKFILVADMKEAALQALESRRGEKIVVQHIDGRRINLGFPT